MINQGEVINQIKKTGYVLEYEVSEILKEHGWIVLNNRYYLDDIKNIDREIDALAYKVTTKKEIPYYTSLIISCKKSDENLWAFLTKDLDSDNPNLDFFPIKNWSNDKILKFMLEKNDIVSKLKSLSVKHNCINAIHMIKRQVFAFQLMKESRFDNYSYKGVGVRNIIIE